MRAGGAAGGAGADDLGHVEAVLVGLADDVVFDAVLGVILAQDLGDEDG